MLRLHDGLAHRQRLRAELAILALFRPAPEPQDHALEPGADALHQLQPRQPEEQRRARGEQRQQQQRRAVESQELRQPAAEDFAQRAAGRLRQRHRQVVQSQRLQRGARQQHEGEAQHAERERMVRLELGLSDAAISGDDQDHARDDPPPGGSAEQIEQQIGEPGARHAAAVGDRSADARERPAGIGLRIRRQDQRQPDECRDDDEPPGFAHEPREARRQRRGRTGRGAAPDARFFLIEKHGFAALTSRGELYTSARPTMGIVTRCPAVGATGIAPTSAVSARRSRSGDEIGAPSRRFGTRSG